MLMPRNRFAYGHRMADPWKTYVTVSFEHQVQASELGALYRQDNADTNCLLG